MENAASTEPPRAPRNKSRFKGMENFLRRIAFNLGNTPSQTEVKIISCIPIDVTDLQQKIAFLEKQLEEANRTLQQRHMTPTYYETETAGPDDHQSKRQLATGHNKEPSRMSDTTFKAHCMFAPKHYVPSAAAYEASKQFTYESPYEVQSDHRLYEPNAYETPPNSYDSRRDYEHKAPSIVQSALLNGNYPRPSSMSCRQGSGSHGDKDHNNSVYNRESSKARRSTVSFLCPEVSSRNSAHRINTFKESPLMKGYKQVNDIRKNLFQKMPKKKDKMKPHLVYYAQMMGSPFRNYDKTLPTVSKDKDKTLDKMNRSYIVDVMRKQYKSITAEKSSNMSEYSSPICRDTDEVSQSVNESDELCSCLHENFENLDLHMTNKDQVNYIDSWKYDCSNVKTTFYDSSLYDIIPVKEKSTKIKDSTDKQSSKNYLPQMDTKSSQETCRNKIIYYTNAYSSIKPKNRNAKKIATTRLVHNVPKKTKRFKDVTCSQTIPDSTSVNCSIKCGIVYKKKKSYKQSTSPTKKFTKSVCCTNVDNISSDDVKEKETVVSKESETKDTDNKQKDSSVPVAVENSTEDTLNQIKSILKTVLTEVKTNAQPKSNVEMEKKDAVVQKEVSQSDVQACSALMHSFTYSPFNMNQNQCPDSRSFKLPSTSFCYSGLPCSPVKCYQNLPVLIHTPSREPYNTGCFRHSSHVNKSLYSKHAVAAATNTDSKINDKRGAETQKLIKEIYNSMELNLDYPSKETCKTDGEIKSQKAKSAIHSRSDENKRCVVRAMSDNLRKKDVQPEHFKSVTHHSNTTTTKHSFKSYKGPPHTRHMKRNNKLIKVFISEDNMSSGCVTVTNIEEGVVKKLEKQCFFSKMFNTFKIFKRKKDVKDKHDIENVASDSDYQTVYSRKIQRVPKYISIEDIAHLKPKSHSKILSSRYYQWQKKQEKLRKGPYLEQEDRRYWDEKLMFAKGKRQHSTDFYLRKSHRLSADSGSIAHRYLGTGLRPKDTNITKRRKPAEYKT